jgi:hypothetical protein
VLLDVCGRRDIRRIVVEAPAVLGWERCREVEDASAVGLLRACLEQALERGELDSDSPDVLAQLLAAVFNEAGMVVAAADDPDAARCVVSRELDRILRGLQAVPPARTAEVPRHERRTVGEGVRPPLFARRPAGAPIIVLAVFGAFVLLMILLHLTGGSGLTAH